MRQRGGLRQVWRNTGYKTTPRTPPPSPCPGFLLPVATLCQPRPYRERLGGRGGRKKDATLMFLTI